MGFGGYVRDHLVDFLLCACMGVGLGLNVVQGFHIPDAVAENVLIVALATVLPAIPLMCAGYSKRSLAIGVPLIVVGVIAYVTALSNITATPVFEESYANDALVFVVLLPVSFCVYLLARTRAGLIVLFVVGCVSCGAIQFLYGKDLVAPTAAFMVSCAASYLFKNARSPLGEHHGGKPDGAGDPGRAPAGVVSDSGAGAPSPLLGIANADGSSDSPSLAARLPRFAMSAGLALVAAAVSACVFMLVIAPLNPPAHELKLITEYYSLEEVHVSGVLSFLHQRNDAISSSQMDDEERQTSSTGDQTQEAEGSAEAHDGEDEQLGDGSFDALSVGDPLSMVRYLQEHWWVGLIVLVVLAIAWIAVVVARRLQRRRRLDRWRSLGPRAEFTAAFEYVCAILQNARVIDRGSKTPHELAESAQSAAWDFEGGVVRAGRGESGAQDADGAERRVEQLVGADGADGEPGAGDDGSPAFSRLAECFARVSYGGCEPTPQEIADAESYVRLVPKRLSRAIGKLHYIRHFFRA